MLMLMTVPGGPKENSKFEALYHAYRAQMLHVAHSILHDPYLAEDAVQEAFFRLSRNLHKVGGVDSPETRGFLLTITKNAALTLSKTGPTAGLGEEALQDLPSPQRTEDLIFERAGFEDLVAEILSLEERYRSVLYLQWVTELSVKEMSRLLKVPQATVKQRLYRGKKLLREQLRQKGYEP